MAQINSLDTDKAPLAEILQKSTELRVREILGFSERQLMEMARQLPAGTLERMIRGLMSQAGPSPQGRLAQLAAERLVEFNCLHSTDGNCPNLEAPDKVERKA